MTNDKDQLAFELASAAMLLDSVVQDTAKDGRLELAIFGFLARVAQAEGKSMSRDSPIRERQASLGAYVHRFALVVRSCSEIDDVLILAAKRFLKDAEGAIG